MKFLAERARKPIDQLWKLAKSDRFALWHGIVDAIVMADGMAANKQFRNDVVYHPIEIELGIVLSRVLLGRARLRRSGFVTISSRW